MIIRGRRRLLAASAVLLALGLGGCGDDDVAAPPPQPESSEAAGPDFSGADLWLSFEEVDVGYDGADEYADQGGGPYAGRVVTANGGEVEQVTGASDGGMAVEFPSPCADASGCARAMVEVAPAAALNPGEADFTYGARVRLDPTATSKGSNIVQKGRFGDPDGQWKLQVDGEAGEPSCVVRGDRAAVTVRSKVSIADGAWHRVVCRRDAEGVSIDVDGAVERETGPTGVVSNDGPIRIGSPGVADDDDQFFGELDDVFLEIVGAA